MAMAGQIVVLNAGNVEQFGTPEELFMRPANKFVARFIGSPRMNLLPARLVGSEAYVYGTVEGCAEEVVLHMPDHRKFTAGERQALTFDPSHAHVFRTDTNATLFKPVEA